MLAVHARITWKEMPLLDMPPLSELLNRLDDAPETVDFQSVISLIDQHYAYTPTRFRCGSVESEAGSNEGSCKILAFGKMHALSSEKTLALFGKFYREDVLQHPQGTDHSNIRNFMKFGWGAVSFDNDPLA